MPTINRAAIVIRPKQPFLDWLHYVDPRAMSLTLERLRSDTPVYLAPEFDTNEEVLAWLEGEYENIFEDQLAGWYNRPPEWPQERTFAMFQQWFEISIHSELIDLSIEPLLHDEE